MFVEVRKHVVHCLLLLAETTVGNLVLQLTLHPVDDPILDFLEGLPFQICEVYVQLAVLHHLHDDVA